MKKRGGIKKVAKHDREFTRRASDLASLQGVNLEDPDTLESLEKIGEDEAGGFEKTRRARKQDPEEEARPRKEKGQKRPQPRPETTPAIVEEKTEEVTMRNQSPVRQPERQPRQETGMREGRAFGLRPIYPRIQAVVDEILNTIPPLPQDIKWRYNRSRGERQTVFTIYSRDNQVTIPDAITPNSWKLSLAVEKREGEAVGVVYLSEGRAKSVRPFILRRPGQPELLIYGFCSTKGRTSRAYVIQVNKNSEVLMIEWSLSAEVHSAQRDREREPSVEERLPGLGDVERTRRSLPALLAPMADTLCFLYDRACGKPMPQREETAPAQPEAKPEAKPEPEPKPEPEAEAAPATKPKAAKKTATTKATTAKK